MVYVEGGHNPTYKHLDKPTAEKEAKRLTKLTNKKAYVLCTVKSYEIIEFNEEDCVPDGEELPF